LQRELPITGGAAASVAVGPASTPGNPDAAESWGAASRSFNGEAGPAPPDEELLSERFPHADVMAARAITAVATPKRAKGDEGKGDGRRPEIMSKAKMGGVRFPPNSRAMPAFELSHSRRKWP
jgi:hypothetical protein